MVQYILRGRCADTAIVDQLVQGQALLQFLDGENFHKRGADKNDLPLFGGFI